MPFFACHDIVLELRLAADEYGDELEPLLDGLSFRRTEPSEQADVCIAIGPSGPANQPVEGARELFRLDGFRAVEAGGSDFYLTDGASLFHLQARTGRGDAALAPSFFDKRPSLRTNFWAFGLLKLLRPRGIFSLHAAGVVSPQGAGVLIIGASGSGKTTLALGLIRQGWRYLSDDAVLLRARPGGGGVEALAFRKGFYVDGSAGPDYQDLEMGEPVPDASGGDRRPVDLRRTHPGLSAAGCWPGILLFPRIVPAAAGSVIAPISRSDALGRLLEASGPQLFDRATISGQLELLNVLVRQTSSYQVEAGSDLRRDSMGLLRLMSSVE
jgi:hypothetical protein